MLPKRHANDGHHCQTSVCKFGAELPVPCKLSDSDSDQHAVALHKSNMCAVLLAGSWMELPNPTFPRPKLPLP